MSGQVVEDRGLRALVAGYASLDRAIQVDRCPGPGTTGVIRRIVDDTRRPGGIAQTALALATGGVEVSALTLVGHDAYGHAYVEALKDGGIDTSHILLRRGRSPYTDLLYAEDGSTACLFHPGTPGAWPLEASHTAAVGEADLVVCMVGPADVTTALLDALSDDTTLAWVIKDDREALGAGLKLRLSGRADLIFCNQDERSLIDTSVLRRQAVVVQTAGPRPVEVTMGGATSTHEVPKLDRAPIDPTGAGDAFAGGFLAAHVRGSDVSEAVSQGLAASRRLLQSRAIDR